MRAGIPEFEHEAVSCQVDSGDGTASRAHPACACRQWDHVTRIRKSTRELKPGRAQENGGVPMSQHLHHVSVTLYKPSDSLFRRTLHRDIAHSEQSQNRAGRRPTARRGRRTRTRGASYTRAQTGTRRLPCSYVLIKCREPCSATRGSFIVHAGAPSQHASSSALFGSVDEQDCAWARRLVIVNPCSVLATHAQVRVNSRPRRARSAQEPFVSRCLSWTVMLDSGRAGRV
jgi:hypothetical protein